MSANPALVKAYARILLGGLMQNRIYLSLNGSDDVWMARFAGPMRSQILEAFGTDTLPTAFSSQADPEAVERVIQGQNPDALIFFEEVRRA